MSTENEPARPCPVVLCVLDGWGERAEPEDNAIAAARTPTWDRLIKACPHSVLDASAESVGLPAGQMGNSEVGHMNLGAGRVVLQDLPRIDRIIAENRLPDLPALSAFVDALRQSGGTAHVMGLLSPGGVHSHMDHIFALVALLARSGIPVAIHAFLDGRDTPPKSASEYMTAFQARLDGLADARVATVSGRYYAMDRDKRWERVAKAYAAVVEATGERAATALAAICAAYDAGQSDEFVSPTVIGDYAGINDGDGLLMSNFRADRAREILHALLDPVFDGFRREKMPRFAAALGMIEYSEALAAFLPALFPAEQPTDTLGDVVADAGLRQLRIAETEKYAHVTFFLNGGREKPFEGEERILVPSPKVATYDLQPEMSAPEVTDRLIEAIENDHFDLIVVNYANTDMVGHTGNFDAAVQAVEAVDKCLGRLVAAVEQTGGVLLITADHGNAELMRDAATGQAHTAHSRNRVPCVLVNGPANVTALANGRLADIAPTVLALMKLPQPRAMNGSSLLVSAGGRKAASAAA